MKGIWLENKTDYSYNVRPLDKNGDVVFEKVLPVEIIDGSKGTVIQSGILALTEDEFEAVKSSCRFINKLIANKKVIVHDKLPANAVTAAEKLTAALDENAKLKAELAKLKKGKETETEETEAGAE